MHQILWGCKRNVGNQSMENFLKDHKGQFKTTYMEGFGDDANNQLKVSDVIAGIKSYQMVGFKK